MIKKKQKDFPIEKFMNLICCIIVMLMRVKRIGENI